MNGNSINKPGLFGNNNSVLTGVFLIIFGGIFMAGSFGFTVFGYNPWILMALLPVFWISHAAYRAYQAEGRITGRVLVILAMGTMPFVYVGAAILGFNAGKIWPVFLILIGVCFLLTNGRK